MEQVRAQIHVPAVNEVNDCRMQTQLARVLQEVQWLGLRLDPKTEVKMPTACCALFLSRRHLHTFSGLRRSWAVQHLRLCMQHKLLVQVESLQTRFADKVCREICRICRDSYC